MPCDTLPPPALYFLRFRNCRYTPAPMERSVVPLSKLPRVQQLLGQALPLEKQKSTDKQARDRESFGLEERQKGH